MAYALDKSRLVYVNLGEHDQLKDEIESTLIENGFDKKQIIYEPAKRFARKDDYAVEIVRNKETYF